MRKATFCAPNEASLSTYQSSPLSRQCRKYISDSTVPTLFLSPLVTSIAHIALATLSNRRLDPIISQGTTSHSITMSHPILFRSTLCIAALQLLLGGRGIFQPEALLRSGNIPVPTQSDARKITQAVTRLFAVRNVALGFLNTVIWYQGDEKVAGVAMIAAVFISLSDGFVSRWLTGGGEWNHWLVTAVTSGMAAGLLGFF